MEGKSYMLRDSQIPGRVASRWSNSHTLQFGAARGDISSLRSSYTDLVRPVIICHKASQSILISHLLLVTVSCKRNLGLGLGYCTSPRERERRQRGGEATERHGERRVQQHKWLKISTVPGESEFVFLLWKYLTSRPLLHSMNSPLQGAM